MKTKPTYLEIANNYALWMEYADPQGLDSEADFNAMNEQERIAFLVSCFGDEKVEHAE